MKSFVAMYLLMGLVYGFGIVRGQQQEVAWWEPPAIVATLLFFWPAVMILDVGENVRARQAVTAGAR